MSEVLQISEGFSNPSTQALIALEDADGLNRALRAIQRERQYPSVDLPPDKLAQRNTFLTVCEGILRTARDRTMDDLVDLWIKHRVAAKSA